MSEATAPLRALAFVSLSLNTVAVIAAWFHDGLGLAAFLVASFGVNGLSSKLKPAKVAPSFGALLMMLAAYVGVFVSSWMGAGVALLGCVLANVVFAVSMRVNNE